ncbi:pilin [Nocardia wallacei]|uniref:pilin n=1 Tax=Nocardia wallacei TaxID=480035 RepID=UPI002457B3B6|nr:pilin [Nocardia wallacei]
MRKSRSPIPAPDRGGTRRRRLAPPVLTAIGAVAALYVVAAPVSASPPVVLAVAGSLAEVLNNLRNWLIGILATVATVYLTVGGARYLLSGGDAGEVERAKSCVRAALIGYSLAILAPVVVEVLKSLVGG